MRKCFASGVLRISQLFDIETPPNETVGKPILERAFPGQVLIERPVSRVKGISTDVLLRQGSVEHPKDVDLADVVYQSEQHQLYIHLVDILQQHLKYTPISQGKI
jgi:hypothetical protein